MRRVPTSSLLPGMVVGHPVYNSRGEVLLNSGVVLTEKYIDSLKKLGYPALYIIDESLPEIYVEDVIDDSTRMQAVALARRILNGGPVHRAALNKALVGEVKNTVRDIIDQLLESPSLVVNMVDIRSMDDYLFAHSVNVCVLALITGISLGYSQEKLLRLGVGALMHDMGKTLIPQSILNKPGPLTKEEFEIVKEHTSYGYTILTSSGSQVPRISALIALQHHERYGGDGYPKGLDSRQIHEFAQIVGIADVYDAMTADRVYRKAYPPHEAYEMLMAAGDYMFDYCLVKTFLSHIAAYPAGTLVQLSSGEVAIAVETKKGYSLYPKVVLLADPKGNPLPERKEIDLSTQTKITIVKVLEPSEIEALRNKRRAARPLTEGAG